MVVDTITNMNLSLDDTNNSMLEVMTSTNFQLNVMHENLYGGTWGKIGYFFMMFANHIVGAAMLSGIIIFETFGGDPQKRNVINRLLSLYCANALLVGSLVGVCRVWRELSGLIDVQIMIWIDWATQIAIKSSVLFWNEMTILRFLYIVVWKRVRGFDDRFWTLFLTILTYSWAFYLTAVEKYFTEMSVVMLKVHTANLKEDIKAIRSSVGVTGAYIMYSSLILQVYALGHIAYYKWKYCRQDNEVHIFYIAPEAERDVEGQRHSTNKPNLNNTAYNKLLFEVKTIIIIAIMGFIFLLTMYVVGILQETGYNRALHLIYYIEDWTGVLAIFIIFPCYFYKCNPEARVYIKQMFCNAK